MSWIYNERRESTPAIKLQSQICSLGVVNSSPKSPSLQKNLLIGVVFLIFFLVFRDQQPLQPFCVARVLATILIAAVYN